jgi:hypothetical protein
LREDADEIARNPERFTPYAWAAAAQSEKNSGPPESPPTSDPIDG